MYRYYFEFNEKYAIDWQYGMKEVIEFVKNNPKYRDIYMTNVRGQPYIFFLFYTQKPLEEYLSEVEYNNIPQNKNFNLVASFDKYLFEYWDPISILPVEGNIYILTPDQYDGLKYKSAFKVKNVIEYPNKTTAFYMVSVN